MEDRQDGDRAEQAGRAGGADAVPDPLYPGDPWGVAARFGAMVLGGELTDQPPAPDTPLGRIRAYSEEHGIEAVTDEHIRAAMEGRPLPPPAPAG